MTRKLDTQADIPATTNLLTETEVLSRLRISRPTLSRWRKSNKFPPPLKMYEGGGIRWPAKEVEAWIASRPRA